MEHRPWLILVLNIMCIRKYSSYKTMVRHVNSVPWCHIQYKLNLCKFLATFPTETELELQFHHCEPDPPMICTRYIIVPVLLQNLKSCLSCNHKSISAFSIPYELYVLKQNKLNKEESENKKKSFLN